MGERMVQCVKLGQELPGLDESTPEGSQALKMALLLGGPQMRDVVRDRVSAKAWAMWKDMMMMVINEYRLDPTSDASNEVLRKHMESFLFGEGEEIPGYSPPK
jgi:Fe-S cluster biosynthesis and repair protein YggX